MELNGAEVARLAVAALGPQGKPWHLALDRANWRIGKTDLNILVLGVAYDELRAPLFWGALDKAGNANAAGRIDLMQTFKDTFQNQPVASLTGGRAFFGNAWIAWLQAAGIPRFLRPREDMHIFEDMHTMTIARRGPRGNTRRG